MRVLITRPTEQAEPLARELERRGHAVLIEPLLTIERMTQDAPKCEGLQGVLLTSANAAHALRGELSGLPVYAVGGATAKAAQEAGCVEVHVAGGDASHLARLVIERCRPAAGALLHLSGTVIRESLAADLEAHGFEVRRQIVYRAGPAGALSPELQAALRARAIDAVLFFSPRTAATFAKLAGGARLAGSLGHVDALCLSEAVAEACRPLTWRRVLVARRPDQTALLELLEGPGRRW